MILAIAMKKYKQLSLRQRCEIECLLGQGMTQSEIYRQVKVHRSTICREFHRNVYRRGPSAKIYNAELSQKRTVKRERIKFKGFAFTVEMKIYMRDKMIKERWSPELISVIGRRELGDFVSHKTIYKYLLTANFSSRLEYREDKKLHHYLRHAKLRQKRKNSK